METLQDVPNEWAYDKTANRLSTIGDVICRSNHGACSFCIFCIVEETDEGTAAHIFQLLIVAQVPFIAFLAFKWLALAPRQALFFIVLQVSAVLAAIVAVFFLTS